jgi:ankyrin repeat protein
VFEALDELVKCERVDEATWESRDGFGRTICHLLVIRLGVQDKLNRERLLKFFQSIPSSFNWLSVDCRGDTVLHTACSEGGTAEVVQAVLAKAPEAANMRNMYGQTPL